MTCTHPENRCVWKGSLWRCTCGATGQKLLERPAACGPIPAGPALALRADAHACDPYPNSDVAHAGLVLLSTPADQCTWSPVAGECFGEWTWPDDEGYWDPWAAIPRCNSNGETKT